MLQFRIEKRQQGSLLFTGCAIGLSIGTALAVAGGLILLAGVNPLAAYAAILHEALGSLYGLSETLVKTTPLILTGLAVSLAFRMQIWNIGAEGQLYIGACAATWVALFSGVSGIATLPLMLIAAAIAGGLWAAIPALLRAFWQVNEVIVTLLMNYIAILLADYLVYGPWKDPAGFNFPLTARFPSAASLGEFFGTRLHGGFFLALLCAFALYLLMEHTTWGFEIKTIGSNPRAASYAGMNTRLAIFLVLSASGAIAAIAGFSEVAGLQHRLQHGISPGYGYTAIIIAWLARRSAIGVVIVSFLMGILLVGGDSLQLTWQLPVAFAYAFQGLILFFLLAGDFFINFRLRRVRRAEDV